MNSDLSNMYTLKVNIRAQEERERRAKDRQTREAISKIQATKGPPSRPRKRKGLNFHEPGTFVSQGEQLRKKLKLEALQKRIAAKAAKTGVADAAKLATLTAAQAVDLKNKAPEYIEDPVPDVEWWDKAILGGEPLDRVIFKLNLGTVAPRDLFNGITNLVERPPTKGLKESDKVVAQVPIFLTAKERKKLRRQNRKNLETEKQEKIKLGLLPKPEPKLKRSNIMLALGDEAITNPSKAEQLVRDQEEKRLQAHLEHNQSKKLSVEEKKLKKLRKIQEDVSITGIWVSVYRVLKIDKNAKNVEYTAKQLTMTGTIAIYKNINLIVVEGGPKQQRKFKRLVMDRIRWSQDPLTASDESDLAEQSRVNKCLLVWEGQVKERAFRFVKVKHFKDESDGRKYFREFNVEHYWDLAFKMSILESISDT